MRHVAEMFLDPRVRVDRVEVTLPAVGQNYNAGGVVWYFVLKTFDGGNHTARRTAGHNCFVKDQTTAADHAVEIGNVYTFLG